MDSIRDDKPEIYHMINEPDWFTGTIIKRGTQPGIFVPRDRFHAKTETTPATLAKVVMVADRAKYFTRAVAKVNTGQRIVHVPKYIQNEFVAGTKCKVYVVKFAW
jgi:hypothetical protein